MIYGIEVKGGVKLCEAVGVGVTIRGWDASYRRINLERHCNFTSFITHFMKKLLSALLLLWGACTCASAATYKITGKVVDNEGEPEAFATVRIFNASDTVKPVTTGVTSDDGVILLSVNKTGQYAIKVSSIGRKDIWKEFTVDSANTDLGTLEISTNENLLQEVTVTAQRPLISKEIDRIGYDVQGDDESKTATLEDILRKVPLVSVDDDGTIKVKGSTSFRIYKDGKPNNMLTNNAKEIFKAIPASMIKKIEVITEPGAREDAEGVGAILNIVTMEAVQMGGVMGTVGVRYNSLNDVPAVNAWVSAQVKKLTMSTYAGYDRIGKGNKNHSTASGRYADTGNELRTESESYNPGWITFFGLDGSYELDSLNLITAEFGGYYYAVDGNSSSRTTLQNATGDPIYSYLQNTHTGKYSYLNFNGGLNYQRSTHRKGETITLSYRVSTTDQTNDNVSEYSEITGTMPVPYTGITQDFHLKFLENTFQADWSRMYAEIHKLDLGLKYIHRSNKSNTTQEYIGIDNTNQIDFRHTTQVAAAYADYRLTLGKWGFRAGLRYEYSKLSAKYKSGDHPSFASNLSDWVPNAALSYTVNDANTLKLSFGTRISRPGIDYLDPTVSTSPTATTQGNPYLESGRNTSLSLNYNFIGRNLNLDFTAGYSFNNNDIVEVKRVEGDHTYSTYANAGRNKTVDLNLYMQWTAGKKTSIMLNGGASYDHYANPSLNITHGGWSGYLFTRLSQKLPWGITGQVGIAYWSGYVDGLYSSARALGMLNQFFSLQKSFLKEDRLTVRLMLQTPFHSKNARIRVKSYNVAFDQTSYTYRDQMTSFGISVSYRFGSLNASVKKTAKTIENDDVSGPRSNGGTDGSGGAGGGM